jgi:hypothetical protein
VQCWATSLSPNARQVPSSRISFDSATTPRFGVANDVCFFLLTLIKAGEGEETEKQFADEADYDYMDVAEDEDDMFGPAVGKLGEDSNEDTDEEQKSETPKYRLLVVRPGAEGELHAESEDEEEESSGEGSSSKKGISRKPSARSLRTRKKSSSPRGEKKVISPRASDPRSPSEKESKKEPIPPSGKAKAAPLETVQSDDGENANFSTVVEKPTEDEAFNTVVSRDQVTGGGDDNAEEEDGFSTTVVRPSDKDIKAAPPQRSPRRVSPEKSTPSRRSVARVGRGVAVPGKASEFGSKLKNIYREDLVTKLPFLTLDSLEPLSLVSTDKRVNNFRYAMSEVASTQPAAAMLEGAHFNAIVGNLLKTHQARTKESKSVPMTLEEQQDHESMICDISDVLKVLLL